MLEGPWPQAALLMLWLMLSLCLQHPPGSTRPGSRRSRSILPSVPLRGFSMTAQVGPTPSSLRPPLFPDKLLSSPLSSSSPLFVCLSLPGGCRHPKDQNSVRVLGSCLCAAHSWHIGVAGGGGVPSLKGLPRLPQVGVLSVIPLCPSQGAREALCPSQSALYQLCVLLPPGCESQHPGQRWPPGSTENSTRPKVTEGQGGVGVGDKELSWGHVDMEVSVTHSNRALGFPVTLMGQRPLSPWSLWNN